MKNLRPWIDKIPVAAKAVSSQLQQADRSVMAVVSGTPESDVSVPAGMVEVTIPDSSEPPAVVPADGGITSLGAEVLCKRDSTGRITSASTPTRLPVGAQQVAVGVTGERLVQLDATQVDQGAQIDRVEAGLDSARVELSAAMERLNDPDTGLDATQQKADDAATAAAQASVDASSAVVLRVDSTRGLVFKNSLISTVLSVTVFAKGLTITDIVALQNAFGAGAYLEWRWRRVDDSDFGVISSSDSRVGAGGFTLTVSQADVDTKTVFMCVLNT